MEGAARSLQRREARPLYRHSVPAGPREIQGRFIFTYDLRRAFEDGVFGAIRYQPVNPAAAQNPDAAIAIATEQQFTEDKLAGFQHRVNGRTDSRKRAFDLLTLYQLQTGLRLKIVIGDKSLRYVRNVINALRAGELDGIVCVNMLGEGFNFPSLKIAAIHSPHRSLSVTLQFIGRFARTVGDNLGPATLLAVPSEIEIEAERLYDTRAVWQEMVRKPSWLLVSHEEARIRDVLETFTRAEDAAPDLADLSLDVLEPYFHVKVFQLTTAVDLRAPVMFPADAQVVYRAVSDEHNAAVYITRETNLPALVERRSPVLCEAGAIHLPPRCRVQSSLHLRLTTKRRSLPTARGRVPGGQPHSPAACCVNRALNGVEAPEFFNVGMRNRVASNTTEWYRIVTGSNADKVIGRTMPGSTIAAMLSGAARCG